MSSASSSPVTGRDRQHNQQQHPNQPIAAAEPRRTTNHHQYDQQPQRNATAAAAAAPVAAVQSSPPTVRRMLGMRWTTFVDRLAPLVLSALNRGKFALELLINLVLFCLHFFSVRIH